MSAATEYIAAVVQTLHHERHLQRGVWGGGGGGVGRRRARGVWGRHLAGGGAAFRAQPIRLWIVGEATAAADRVRYSVVEVATAVFIVASMLPANPVARFGLVPLPQWRRATTPWRLDPTTIPVHRVSHKGDRDESGRSVQVMIPWVPRPPTGGYADIVDRAATAYTRWAQAALATRGRHGRSAAE